MAGELTNHVARFYLRRREFRIQIFSENKLQAFITKKKALKT
jgi:hypothetical protein